MSAAAGWVLGVDFGVVNTAAALRDPSGRVSELRLSSTGVLMPSAVFCPEQQLLVGDGALRAGLSDPGALVPYPKRRLADGMRCKLAVAGQQAYVPGLVAAVFADVRKRAREATGGDLPQDLMLSYPDIHHASFAETSQRRDGLQEAADLLGCRRCQLVSDSTAVTGLAQSEAQLVSPALLVVNFGAVRCDAVVCTRQYDGGYAAVAARSV
ncbi:MAG TPA: hypothetical protein VF874_08990, partial [Mycobacterium sp.]